MFKKKLPQSLAAHSLCSIIIQTLSKQPLCVFFCCYFNKLSENPGPLDFLCQSLS